ncbi:cupin domain-containing protein [Methanopyrus sp.]
MWTLTVSAEREHGPCGRVRELYSNDKVSVAEVSVQGEGEEHYHRRTFEVYYVIDGRGKVVLNGRPVDVGPGDVVAIEPGIRHKVVGNLKMLVVCIPPFDPEDVYLV